MGAAEKGSGTMKGMHSRLLMVVLAIACFVSCATIQNRWEATKSADTIAAYEDFLREYPDDDLADQARLRRNDLREERDWRDAEAKHTLSAYEDFRKNYPQGRHKNDADARLEMLSPHKAADLPHVSTEKFLKRYQQGIFMDETLLSGERLSFDQAMTADTISAYEDFLNRYPVGRLADDARRRMDKLSFGQARAEDTVAAYGGYLSRYPQGAFAGEARSRRATLNALNPASEWGRIVYPNRNMNIRAKRSAASKLKGQLKAGQPVKVDFLQGHWYAVFPATQKERNEKMALGYVYAPLFGDDQGADPSGSTAAPEKSAHNASGKNRETESPSVEVKHITFKAAGDGKELLFIEFDRFYPPTISGIEGDDPRIILEIRNAAPLREEWAVINTGGNFIRQIRSRMDAQTRAALIVLDMVPEKAYYVSQTFYKKENMYSLEISEKEEMPLP